MSRYYDANICRFVNADGQLNTTSLLGYNLFAYCENNPVVRIDPNGDFYITGTAVGYGLAYLCAAVVSTVAGVILADVISDVLNKLSAIFSRSKTEEIETPKSVTEAEEKDVSTTLQKTIPKDPVHHIVAKADPRAAESRQILMDVGIEPLTDPRNLVPLPKSYHASLHTTAYHNYVTERLRPVAGDKAAIEATLASIKAEILVRSAAGIRWD